MKISNAVLCKEANEVQPSDRVFSFRRRENRTIRYEWSDKTSTDSHTTPVVGIKDLKL
jgi:hypothetical protein